MKKKKKKKTWPPSDKVKPSELWAETTFQGGMDETSGQWWRWCHPSTHWRGGSWTKTRVKGVRHVLESSPPSHTHWLMCTSVNATDMQKAAQLITTATKHWTVQKQPPADLRLEAQRDEEHEVRTEPPPTPHPAHLRPQVSPLAPPGRETLGNWTRTARSPCPSPASSTNQFRLTSSQHLSPASPPERRQTLRNSRGWWPPSAPLSLSLLPPPRCCARTWPHSWIQPPLFHFHVKHDEAEEHAAAAAAAVRLHTPPHSSV